jgi:transcriptional regulator with XRE-family HTH domain
MHCKYGANEFGEWLRSVLKEYGISQKRLSEETGICERTIRRYVYGDVQPSGERMRRVLDYFESHLAVERNEQ